MTTEEDFQRALDADPRDWHTRLVFADWLDDRDDPRAAGYRAIAVLRRYPLHVGHAVSTRPGWWWYCSAEGPPRASHNCIPADWFALLPPQEGNKHFWPVHRESSGTRSRRECEDALARAFRDLPADRQTALLVQSPQPATNPAPTGAAAARKPARTRKR